MDYVYSIILGAIQGLTEFWPISSSGHLVVAHELLGFEFVNDVSFDVALHWGTLLALLVYFRQDVARLIVAFVRSLGNWRVREDQDQRLAWLIVLGTIPAAVVGYFFNDLIETTFRSPWLVGVLLIGVGGLLLVAERYGAKVKGLDKYGWKSALLVGIAQAVALLPGVSRSGITIITGMSRGFTREAAARFSFLLSMPVVFGAGLQTLPDALEQGLSGSELVTLVLGFLTAAGVGYVAVAVLLRFLARRPLNVFAYYRFVIGGTLLLYLALR